jgi:hypothetical protein
MPAKTDPITIPCLSVYKNGKSQFNTNIDIRFDRAEPFVPFARNRYSQPFGASLVQTDSLDCHALPIQ